ncbi:MAG: hypothetical protein KKH08_06285 [Candidatus Omnitrophica bacterium]|nr:hypothetical protein [Candidatus Omnitrophota bacterium]
MRKGIDKKVFFNILGESKNRLLSIKGGLKKIKSGDEFEAMLFQVIQEICAELKIRDVMRTGKQTFPDIIIWPYGIEAKSTISDSWISTGNSIVETTRVKDLEEIYIYFLKQGNKNQSDIRFRSYEECLSDIVVTHSPRYKIDMGLSPDDNIFKKMGTDYKTFSQSDSIKIAKDYYRGILKEGEELWWIDQQDDVGMAPIIKNFGDLEKETQEQFKAEAMVFFPEVFSNSNRKYIKAALHLLRKYQATCSSLRDLFTSGGQEIIIMRGKNVKISKILYNLYLNAKQINYILKSRDNEELSRMWGIRISKGKTTEEIWLVLLKEKSETKDMDPCEIYKEGLRA